ncbi:hypothetical protein [Oceanibium sediminis]|uniref:hypothetical protein n=1 Tax=Oceanibium sediminis TaxID=2026339 RepID=UPI000DD42B07|nr:hypothetical protein [Oceanibium sediminis]
MSRHILDHRSVAKPGLRLSRFARFTRQGGLSPRMQRLFRSAKGASPARTRAYFNIERNR